MLFKEQNFLGGVQVTLSHKLDVLLQDMTANIFAMLTMPA